MVARVTITLDLPRELVARAKAHAAREGVTLDSLIEQGLRMVLARRRTGHGFRLRDRSVEGRGLQPPFREGGWPVIREAIYEGRGA